LIAEIESQTIVNNHHKTLINEDAKIESANKRLQAATASFDRAEERIVEVHKRAAMDPAGEKLKGDLERVAMTCGRAANTYAKALDASVSTIGTGSGRVMVLLPSRVVDNSAMPK
jgi:hypothetical protein